MNARVLVADGVEAGSVEVDELGRTVGLTGAEDFATESL